MQQVGRGGSCAVDPLAGRLRRLPGWLETFELGNLRAHADVRAVSWKSCSHSGTFLEPREAGRWPVRHRSRFASSVTTVSANSLAQASKWCSPSSSRVSPPSGSAPWSQLSAIVSRWGVPVEKTMPRPCSSNHCVLRNMSEARWHSVGLGRPLHTVEPGSERRFLKACASSTHTRSTPRSSERHGLCPAFALLQALLAAQEPSGEPLDCFLN